MNLIGEEMQIILDIEAGQKDIILNIINNLKEGIVTKYTLVGSENAFKRSDIEPLNPNEEQEIKEILSTMSIEDKQIVDSRKYSIDL